jgi:hypothetical protein
MYSEEQYRKALEVYEETKSVTKTITIFGISGTQANAIQLDQSKTNVAGRPMHLLWI